DKLLSGLGRCRVWRKYHLGHRPQGHFSVWRRSKFLFESVLIILVELPEHVRIAFFGIDGQHAEFDEFVWLNAADPEGADDLALVVFLEVNLPARLELEIIDLQARREVAFDADGRGLPFVGNAH